MDERTKRKLIVTVAVVLTCVIVWSATADIRSRNSCMRSIEEVISNYRSGEGSSINIGFPDSLPEDTKFEKFLLTQAQEMCQNDELELLISYLNALERRNYESAAITETADNYFLAKAQKTCQARDLTSLIELLSALDDFDYTSPSITAMVTDYFSTAESIEEALEIKNRLEWYGYDFNLNRNSGVLASYIKERGTNPITKSPRSGYYADKKDTSWKNVIGLEGSPLYDAGSITYKGDFKYIQSWGVDLNKWYKEESYSESEYYFRDQKIYFSPDKGECVWAGDYLFCFDSNGELVDYVTVE